MNKDRHVPIKSGDRLEPFSWEKVFDPEYMGKLVSAANALMSARGNAGTTASLSERGLVINAGNSRAATIAYFKVKSIAADYLVCHTWDGTTEGSQDINVARALLCRSVTSDYTITGAEITYVYASEQERTAYNLSADPDIIELQQITPPYYVDCVIEAEATRSTLVADAPNWVESNSSRCWARIFAL